MKTCAAIWNRILLFARHRAGSFVRLAVCLLAFGILTGSSLEAQPQKIIAFGDSVTEALGFDDCPCECREECGYPRRLQNRLRNAGQNVNVHNFGLGGEKTNTALDRLIEVFDEITVGEGDLLLLMEGTNDISVGLSPETTIFNLEAMGLEAALRNVETVHATLIPRFPDALVDPENELNRDLARMIRDTAFSTDRRLVDPFEVWSQIPDLFETYYWDPEDLTFDDPVGHPNPNGFGKLTAIFVDVLTGQDTVPPVVGTVEPIVGAEDVSNLARVRVRLYDFGAGIDPGAAGMSVNGINVPVDTSQGGLNWLDVVHTPTTPLTNPVRVRVSGSDVASPVNSMNRLATNFTVSSTGPDPCIPSTTVLCIDHRPGDRRFRVQMSWETAQGGGLSGQALVTPIGVLGFEGGLMSFFEGVPEVLIKVLDGCESFSSQFWVFAAATTTLGFELEVEDTHAKTLGAPPSVYRYVISNADGNTAAAVSDVTALDTCSFTL